MKNAGLTIGMVAIGLGLASIGFNLNGNTATATSGVFNAGPEEPTIVWYDSHPLDDWGTNEFDRGNILLLRGWNDGTSNAENSRQICVRSVHQSAAAVNVPRRLAGLFCRAPTRA